MTLIAIERVCLLDRVMRLILISLSAFILLLFAQTNAPPAAADDIETPPCLKVSKRAPYRSYGYTHIVHLNNTCKRPSHCRVSTDVTPKRQTIRLAAGEQQDIVSRVGSPASVFEARVDCTL